MASARTARIPFRPSLAPADGPPPNQDLRKRGWTVGGSSEVSSPGNPPPGSLTAQKAGSRCAKPGTSSGFLGRNKRKGKKRPVFSFRAGTDTMVHHSCHSASQAGTERCFSPPPTPNGTLSDKSRLHRTEHGEDGECRRGSHPDRGLHSREARCPVVMCRHDCELASTQLSARGTATPKCNRRRRQDALEFPDGGVGACARLTRGYVHDARSLVLAPLCVPGCQDAASPSLGPLFRRFCRGSKTPIIDMGGSFDAGQGRAKRVLESCRLGGSLGLLEASKQ